MKVYYFALLLSLLLTSCQKDQITQPLAIPSETFLNDLTGDLVTINQRGCEATFGQTCGGVIFSNHPNFSYVLNWTECDSAEELLYYSPVNGCVTSTLFSVTSTLQDNTRQY